MNDRLAGFWIRYLASLIDSIVLSIVVMIVQAIVMGVFYWARLKQVQSAGGDIPSFEDAFQPLFIQMLNIGLYLSLSFPYFVVSHWKWGATLGKRVLKLEVRNAQDFSPIQPGQSALRWMGYFFSGMPMLLGYALAGIHPRKQALHDLIASTVVVKRVAVFALAAFAMTLSLNAEVRADEPISQPWRVLSGAQFVAMSSSVVGADVVLSLQKAPWEGRGLVAGPRLGAMWSNPKEGSRLDAYAGVETTLWIVNLAGPGLAIDLTTRGSPGYRVEGFFTARFLRFGDAGAWALRAGPVWDSRTQWGIKAGLTLQWSGV